MRLPIDTDLRLSSAAGEAERGVDAVDAQIAQCAATADRGIHHPGNAVGGIALGRPVDDAEMAVRELSGAAFLAQPFKGDHRRPEAIGQRHADEGFSLTRQVAQLRPAAPCCLLPAFPAPAGCRPRSRCAPARAPSRDGPSAGSRSAGAARTVFECGNRAERIARRKGTRMRRVLVPDADDFGAAAARRIEMHVGVPMARAGQNNLHFLTFPLMSCRISYKSL